MQNSLKLSVPKINNVAVIGLAVGVACVLMSAGALNGGTALTTGVWDSLSTWMQGLLSSTWVLVLALASLVGAVWQLASGKGFASLGLVLGVLAVALIGPGVITTLSTSTLQPASISAPANYLR
jgi:hypothetical protein